MPIEGRPHRFYGEDTLRPLNSIRVISPSLEQAQTIIDATSDLSHPASLTRLQQLFGIGNPENPDLEETSKLTQEATALTDRLLKSNSPNDIEKEGPLRRINIALKSLIGRYLERLFPAREKSEMDQETLLSCLRSTIEGITIRLEQAREIIEKENVRRILEILDNIMLNPQQLREIVTTPEWETFLKELTLEEFLRFWRIFIPYSSVSIHVTRQGFRELSRTFGLFHVAGLGELHSIKPILSEEKLYPPIIVKFRSKDPKEAAKNFIKMIRDKAETLEDFIKALMGTLTNREGQEAIWDRSSVHFNIDDPRTVSALTQYGAEPALDIAIIYPTALLAALPTSTNSNNPYGGWFLLSPGSKRDIRTNPMPPTDWEKTDFAVFGKGLDKTNATLGEIPLWMGFIAAPGNAIVHHEYGTQYKIRKNQEGIIERIENKPLVAFLEYILLPESDEKLLIKIPQEVRHSENFSKVREKAQQFMQSEVNTRESLRLLKELLTYLKPYAALLHIPQWFVDADNYIPNSPLVSFLFSIRNAVNWSQKLDDEMIKRAIKECGLTYQFLTEEDEEATTSKDYFTKMAQDAKTSARFFFYDVKRGINRELRRLFREEGITRRYEKTKDYVPPDYGYPPADVLPPTVSLWWEQFIKTYIEELKSEFPQKTEYLEDLQNMLLFQLSRLSLRQNFTVPTRA